VLRALERLEARCLLAVSDPLPWTALDVDNSASVEPLDALLLINQLNDLGARPLPPGVPLDDPLLRCDVDGDGWIAPVDALRVINALNAYPLPPVIAGSIAPASDPSGNGVVLVDQVVVVGQTASGAVVSWGVGPTSLEAPADIELASQVVADAQGYFRVEFPVVAGLNALSLATTDPLGRTTSVSKLIRRGDTVLDWNASLLNVIRDWTTFSNDPYANRVVTERPPVAARNLAMVHVAMYDALAGVEQTSTPIHVTLPAPSGASAMAATAAAAHRVAGQLYQAADERAVFDAALAESLAIVPDGVAKDLGIAYGRQVADAVLAWRANDGASATVAYSPGTDPGDWKRTFPDYLPPLLPQWPNVLPFAIPSSDSFLPPPPPSLDSVEYAADVDEVMRLGGYSSTERTADEQEIALFWADGGGTFTPPGHWNQIAADVSLARGESLAENARWFALLNAALADAGIVAWDAKYTYELWRPIDAIRQADSDGNSATTAIATWMPLLKTPPFSSYTSGHSTFSGAAAAVLTARFGDNVPFTTQADGHEGFETRPLPTDAVVSRHFTSFEHAAAEAGRSRVLGGIHYEFDNQAGLTSGRAIGQYVVSLWNP